MSVSSEYVACIDFLLYIVKTGVVSVGYDSLALFLESFKVVDDFATKECRTILKSWFIDNDFCAFCLYMIPCIADCLKLSELDFIVSLKTPMVTDD